MMFAAGDTLFLGYRVRFYHAMPARQRRRLLREIKLSRPKGKPALTVQFVKSLRAVRNAPNILSGEGFALDLSSRILYYPADADRLVVSKKSGTAHLLMHRAIVFSLALLAEANGWRKSCRYVPVYLHASAVATRRGALVFCGDSTFGKSTISGKLLSDYPKLEDDQVMLLVDPAGMATPRVVVFAEKPEALFGSLKVAYRRGGINVAALFWLKKGPSFSIVPLAPAGALSLLMYPMAGWENPQAIVNRMRLLRSLLRKIPCGHLEFRKEKPELLALLSQHRCI